MMSLVNLQFYSEFICIGNLLFIIINEKYLHWKWSI